MSFQNALRQAAENERLKHAEAFKEHYVEYHSSLFSSTAAYDNTVILGGFLAFFALWAGAADDIPRFARLVTVALMGVSLMLYMAVTIGQMLHRQFHLEWRRGELFEKYGTDAVRFNEEWVALDKVWQMQSGKVMRPAAMSSFISIAFGFAAGLGLSYNALGVAFGWPVLVGW